LTFYEFIKINLTKLFWFDGFFLFIFCGHLLILDLILSSKKGVYVAGIKSGSLTSLSVIASSGHLTAQTPQPRHFSVSTPGIDEPSLFKESALKEHASMQIPHSVQSSSSTSAQKRLGPATGILMTSAEDQSTQQQGQQLQSMVILPALFSALCMSPSFSAFFMISRASSLVTDRPDPRSIE
jgi:hypothetical protein